jgi:hypothetical protein
MATVTSTGEGGWIVRDESGELVPHHAEISGLLNRCPSDYTLEVHNEDPVGDASRCLKLGSFVSGTVYKLYYKYMSTPDGKIVMYIEGEIRSFVDDGDLEDYLKNNEVGMTMYMTVCDTDGQQNEVELQDMYNAPFWTMYKKNYIFSSEDEDDDSTAPDFSESEDDD